jgi:2-polyprenyl-3-methyl-5-hydroxy-6-metoxy-1,4-benzoquinol methylase
MAKTAVFIIHAKSLGGLEEDTAQRVCRHLLSKAHTRTLGIFEVERGKTLKVRDILTYKDYDVFVFLNGTVFLTHEGIKTLSRIASKRKELSVTVPVSNESLVSHQRFAPPFIYQTLSVFKWAAEEIYKKFKDEVMDVREADDFCLVFKRGLLKSLPAALNLVDVPQIVKNKKFKFSVAKGVYAHRYGNCYESSRDDLMGHVPPDAREILDIGAARGLFGELLKKRQKCVVTGIEIDNEMMAVGRSRLDNVISGDIEDVIDKKILGTYDCIVCGDILEHLNNPWGVVKKLKDHLKKGGVFIASTPNIMNWSLLFDLLEGRWDYVPFSTLSGTHIRFFTKDTLKELFEDAGYKIKEVKLQSFEIPPQGDRFITSLKNISPGISGEELRASEIVIIAQK